MQVSSILQQCNEDVLLLVEVDTQHHGSHHKIALEEKTVLRSMWKRSHPLLAAIWQLIRNPGLVEARESICKFSFCLSWKPLIKLHMSC